MMKDSKDFLMKLFDIKDLIDLGKPLPQNIVSIKCHLSQDWCNEEDTTPTCRLLKELIKSELIGIITCTIYLNSLLVKMRARLS